MTTIVKIWLCLAVATIAASIADPVMEAASNAGLFGPGNFTDHSNWDIIPCVSVGLVFVVLHCLSRVQKLLLHSSAGEPLPRLDSKRLMQTGVRLLPAAYALQILLLYAMETLEQHVVYGHALGANIWLGGPAVISLSFHALVCLAVFIAAVSMLVAFSEATARFVRIVVNFARVKTHIQRPVFTFLSVRRQLVVPLRVLCGEAERAPPG